MEMSQWLQMYHMASAIPIRLIQDGMETLFLPASCVREFDRAAIDLLYGSDKNICYTLTMEQIAYGIIKKGEDKIILGPAPCVSILGSLLREAVRHAGLNSSMVPSIKNYLNDIAIIPLPQFIQTLHFVAAVLLDLPDSKAYYEEDPLDISTMESAEDDKTADEDPTKMQPYDFGTIQCSAVLHGLPDEVAAQFSRIDSYFPPSKYRITSLEKMHDTVVESLGRAAEAGIMAGLSPFIVEQMRQLYLINLSQLTSVRSMVKLMKTIFMDFASRVRQNNKLKVQDRLSQRILQEIEQNTFQKLTPSLIADHLHMNVNYLSTHFKAVTGKTINDSILDAKIAAAKYLLVATKQPITDIALQLGFSNSCYFSAVFKKRTQQTPKEYRQRNKSR